jgi:hypothetical protein
MPDGQIASCSIRDDGIREALCIQSPEEWEDSSELMERMGLSERLEQLKNNLKFKKRIIINSSRLRNKTSIQQPILPASPGQLEYPGRRPVFNELPIKDPTSAALHAWKPEEESPSYSFVSPLNQQEPLAVIKSKFQASLKANLTRDASPTDSPSFQTDLSATPEIDTSALLEELLSLSNEDNAPLVIAPAPNFPDDSLATSTTEPELSVEFLDSDFGTAPSFTLDSSPPFLISFLDDSGFSTISEGKESQLSIYSVDPLVKYWGQFHRACITI